MFVVCTIRVCCYVLLCRLVKILVERFWLKRSFTVLTLSISPSTSSYIIFIRLLKRNAALIQEMKYKRDVTEQYEETKTEPCKAE